MYLFKKAQIVNDWYNPTLTVKMVRLGDIYEDREDELFEEVFSTSKDDLEELWFYLKLVKNASNKNAVNKAREFLVNNYKMGDLK